MSWDDNDGKDFDGTVHFFEGSYGYGAVSGSFTIKDRGNDKFKITIDGKLYDGRTIKGTYNGLIKKMN